MLKALVNLVVGPDVVDQTLFSIESLILSMEKLLIMKNLVLPLKMFLVFAISYVISILKGSLPTALTKRTYSETL